MIRTSLHCDGCLRTQTEGVGWYATQEIIRAKVLDAEGAKLGVDRALVLRPVALGELPAHQKAYCGVACLTKAMHAWTELVLREQKERAA